MNPPNPNLDQEFLIGLIIVCAILTIYNYFFNPFRKPEYREKWKAEKAKRKRKHKKGDDDDDELVQDALVMEYTGAMDDDEEEEK